MFLSAPSSKQRQNSPLQLPGPVGGLNAVNSVMSMPKLDAVALENWIPYPDKIKMRPGAANHVTGFVNPVDALIPYYATTGANSLWAVTSAGIYNASVAGVVGAAAIALTSSNVSWAGISTGAGTNYLFVFNGVDTAKRYDGAAWTSVAVFGATATSVYSAVEVYKQRMFLVRNSSLTLEYLAPNAIAGAPTVYELGAIFRRGGYIQAIATWTIDGGSGPDDHLVVMTSSGEIGVFSGTDPTSATAWSLRGVYFLGRPLGKNCFFKYGGDLLVLAENGAFPLSRALLTASIDRQNAITRKIEPLFTQAAQTFYTQTGWQAIAYPSIPILLINVPDTTQKYQFVMHLESGAWATFVGWSARCFGYLGGSLYFGMADKVALVGGVSDFGANITATALTSYSNWGYPRNKRVTLAKPYFESSGNFTYTFGISGSFALPKQSSMITPAASGTAALWGSGIFGTSLWSASSQLTSSWRTIPDEHSAWKAIFLQVISNSVSIEYFGCELRMVMGGDF